MATNGQSGNSTSQIYVLYPVWQCPADGLQGDLSVAVVPYQKVLGADGKLTQCKRM